MLHNTISYHPCIWLGWHLLYRNRMSHIKTLASSLHPVQFVIYKYSHHMKLHSPNNLQRNNQTDRQTDTHAQKPLTKHTDEITISNHTMSLMPTVKTALEANTWFTKYRIKRKTMYWHLIAVFCKLCLQQDSVDELP